MSKCKFSDLWLQDERFCAWLKPVEGNAFEAHCALCKITLKLGTLGIKALESLSKSEKYKAVHQPILLRISSWSTEVQRDPVCPNCSQPPDSVWVHTNPNNGGALALSHKHQSYTSKESIDKLFQNMFPDSEIAKKCGKDKTAYIARFGLVDIFFVLTSKQVF